MIESKKGKVPVLSIVLYVIAGFLIIYTLWSLNHSISYISDLIDGGQLTFRENEFEIVSFYMASSFQYFFFAAILLISGLIFQNIMSLKLKEVSEEKSKTPSDNVQDDTDSEEDFDEWFHNIER